MISVFPGPPTSTDPWTTWILWGMALGYKIRCQKFGEFRFGIRPELLVLTFESTYTAYEIPKSLNLPYRNVSES